MVAEFRTMNTTALLSPVCAFLFAFSLVLVNPKEIGVDLWHHLKTGKRIVEHRSIPRQDIYSYTAKDHPWINHQWLAEVIFSKVYQWSGAKGLIFLKATLIALTFFLLCLNIQTRCQNALLSLAFSCTAYFFLSGFFILRPFLFSWIYFLLTPLLIQSRKKKYLAPLMTLWANTHAAFPTGLMLVFIDSIQKAVERDGAAKQTIFKSFTLPIVCVVFTLINPYTFSLYYFVFTNVSSPILLSNIQEWFSPDFHEQANLFFELLLLAPLLIGICVSFSFKDYLLLIFFAHLSLFAQRNIPFYLFIVLPYVSQSVEQRFTFFLKPVTHPYKIVSAFLLILIFIQMISFERFSRKPNSLWSLLDENYYPLESMPALRSILADKNQKLFHSYNWGGYLIWTLKDKNTFMDGRILTVYPEEVMRDFTEVVSLRPSFSVILKRRSISVVFFPQTHPLVRMLRQNSGWEIFYEDTVSSILVRRNNLFMHKKRSKS